MTKGKEFTSLPFVVYVMARCKKFNVNFVISPDKEVIRGGDPCDGYFEAPEKGESGILVICINKKINNRTTVYNTGECFVTIYL